MHATHDIEHIAAKSVESDRIGWNEKLDLGSVCADFLAEIRSEITRASGNFIHFLYSHFYLHPNVQRISRRKKENKSPYVQQLNDLLAHRIALRTGCCPDHPPASGSYFGGF